LLNRPGTVQEKQKGASRAVQNGNFRAVHFDQGVVDAEAGERRHQVLNSADACGRSVGVSQHGAKMRIADVIEACRNIDAQISAAKDDPVTRGCRENCQVGTLSRMNAHTHATDRGFQRALPPSKGVSIGSWQPE
jgi:hypothetical protein